ncbi:MAG TPA: ABC transporter substrate-binding protein [Gammaproteobacteria bacterium]|nr:ABC transporter substrate-binding protein [Gammaproteobacteria bacterium]
MKATLLAVFTLLVSITSHNLNAAPYQPYYPGSYPGYTPYQSRTSEPAAILKRGIGKLTRFIKSGAAKDNAQAMQFIQTEIAPYFDFEYMTRWAAGPAWRRMSPEQRATMQQQLTSSFLNILTQKLSTYSNQPIRYFTPRGQGRDDVSVSAWIMQPTGIPTKLEFRFYKSKSGWKIFDVKAAGNSAVVYYRKQFRDMLYKTSRPRNYN